MEHSAKSGKAKIVKQCSLPLTGTQVVNRIITDLCVLDVTPRGLELVELAPELTLEKLQAATEPTIHVPEGEAK
jgi:3-oxoacid CoA-transferase subunit B